MSDVYDQILTTMDEFGADVRALESTVNAVNPSDHLALIRTFDKVRTVYDRMQEVKKSLNAIYDNLNITLIPEAMREAGVKTVTVEGVGRVTVSHRYSCSMIDKDRGIEWLKENGMEAIVQETVNSSTLAAFAKNRLIEEGKELPEDVFKVGTSPYVSVTKVK